MTYLPPSRPPLTPTELVRREQALSAHNVGQPAIECNASDVKQYGERAAAIIRDCKRNVAIAPSSQKLAAFEAAAKTLSEATADGWLPKSIIADRLQEIAEAHGLFGKTIEDIQQIIAGAAEALAKAPVAVIVRRPASSGLDVICMSDVKPMAIHYVWQNWLAYGKVHVLAGEGGRGKTTLLHDWAARVTRGDNWPDGSPGTTPGSVIILASEDDVEDTIAPRLIAAGADMAKVHVVRSVRHDNVRRGFSLQADLEKLLELIERLGDVRLIIFDPVTSYLGKVDSHNNADVRAVLDPLGEFAARMKVCIVCNNHFSKGGGSANSRVIGSVAFVNQARAAFIVTPDKPDDNRMLLIPSKMNIAPISHGLAYRIEGCLIEHEGKSISTSRIMYESDPVTITADQAVAAVDGGDDRSAKTEAMEFLADALRNGPVSAKDVKRDAAEAGISSKCLRNAREALGVKPEKSSYEGGWVWALPKVPKKPEDAPFRKGAPSTSEGHLRVADVDGSSVNNSLENSG